MSREIKFAEEWQIPTLQIPVESPENIDLSAKIIFVRSCVAPIWKTLLRYFLYISTFFTLYLFNRWVPSLYVFLALSDEHLNRAKKIVVYTADKNVEVVPLFEEHTSTQSLKVFYYKLYKYYFDESEQTFKPCLFKVDRLSYSQIHEQYSEGLEKRFVDDETIFYGKNQTNIPKKSFLELLLTEVLSPFYIFQVYSFMVWFFDDFFVYTYIIIVFSFISVGISIYETMETRKKLRDISHYEASVIVLRRQEGEMIRTLINSSELVPGDLIEIPEDVLMPCDTILLRGSCVMNESMLTGESIPIIKNSLPYFDIYYNPKEDKQYTLYAGTKCIQARHAEGHAALGLVTRTGFSTIKGGLIRTMVFSKMTDYRFASDAYKFVSTLAVVTLIGFFVDIDSLAGDSISTVFIKGSEFVTVAIPPALPTCIQVGVSFALSRLRKKHIYCISASKSNEAGRVNVMCFDKTGTLTEDGLDLLGVRTVTPYKPSGKVTFIKIMKEITRLEESYIQSRKTKAITPSEQVLQIMATCHSLTVVDNKVIGDPFDLKMFEATKWTLEENHQSTRDALAIAAIVRPVSINSNDSQYLNYQEGLEIVRRFEFSSKFQRMSVIVRNFQEQGFKAHIKGSPEKIYELCRPETIPEDFKEVLEQYTHDGYRVLACGSKTLDLTYEKVMAAKRPDVENDFTFIGFLIMENRLKAATTETIDRLHAADIKTIMVTGDNSLTAINVAKQCRIIGETQRIFLGDVSQQKIDGRSFLIWKDFEAIGKKKPSNKLEIELEFKAKRLDELNEKSSNDINSLNYSNLVNESLVGNKDTQNIEIKERPVTNDTNPADSGKGLRVHTNTENDKDVFEEPPFFNLSDYDDYCIALTGEAFSFIIHEAEVNKNTHYQYILERVIKKSLVYARMHPDEKARMIKYLMKNSNKNIVGMCGDGANDVAALKTANIGVSLSEAEASVAAPFTSNIQDISCIPVLLREGRAALLTSYQEFKYMALYSMIQFATVTILYHNLIDLTNWSYYHIDILIVLPMAATMVLSETSDQLTKRKPTGRLVSVEILTSVLGQTAIQVAFQVGVYKLMQKEPWYNSQECIDNFETADACMNNTSLYIISIYQYCVVALVFVVGKPFKKPFYTNFWFTMSFILLMIANVMITYNPFDWQFLYDQEQWAGEVPLPVDWKHTLMFIVIINSLLTIIWEEIIVRYVSNLWEKHREKKRREQEALESMYRPAAPQSPGL